MPEPDLRQMQYPRAVRSQRTLLELDWVVVYNGRMAQVSSVLVVDDDGSMRELIATLMGRAGLACRSARTAKEAIESFERERPSLAILDIDLGAGKSGYELLHELRAEWPELPAIFLSGTRMEASDRVTGLLLGADDYIVKPFSPDELIARVRRLTRKTEPNFVELTNRQREVLALLADGMSQSQIAVKLSIAPRTVASHVESILRGLNARSRAEAVAIAHQRGLTNVTP
jgi:DNA-binding NarL/FixJ family response regulator